MATTNVPVTLETPIAVKVLFQGHTKKFKLPLRDLGAHVLPEKLRTLLQLTADDEVVFERYSDSAGAYVTLDSDKPQIYKTLFRAAKAKLKLRLKATLVGEELEEQSEPAPPPPAHGLPHPCSLHRMSADTLSPPTVPQVAPVIAHSPIPPPPLSMYRVPQVETVEDSPVSPVPSHKAEPVTVSPRGDEYESYRKISGRFAPPAMNDLAFRPKEHRQCSWVVYCNNCNNAMEHEHFHCSICDNGDYDLCPSCVDNGIHCPGSGHWMVKRFVQNGAVVNSTTERVGPKVKPTSVPGAFTQVIDLTGEEDTPAPTRTCNSCVKVHPEEKFVTCTTCDDFDLCMDCHISNEHGHHPGHAFTAAAPNSELPAVADILCNAGRNVRHSAVCDGCEKFIYGVRHKCLNCPDWDYCSECVLSVKHIHPRHRFVPIYEPLAEPVSTGSRHYGIYCDGPLCKDKENQTYIEGVRYKCAVCHDTDFCANCEAIPSNRHNHTHPLIKFKTPVRSVSVTTLNEKEVGLPVARLGDQPARKSAATETIPVAPSSNAATQVQTVVDMKPTEETQLKATKEKIQIRDLLAEPVQEKISVNDLLCAAPAAPVVVPSPLPQAVKPEPVPSSKAAPQTDELDAHFIRDTIPDGTSIGANLNFVQVWTLRNPGPKSWPAGCSVRHVGGDNMLNLDNTRPLSQSELADASESNVIGRKVEAGEEISFRIMMKAPAREGIAISYWRLKTADGTPFGHRLWCDIKVVAPTPAPQSWAAAPSSDTAEPSTSPEPSASLPQPPLESFERLRALQREHQNRRFRQLEKVGQEQSERTARLHEEALDRLRKMKLHLDEKENQTRRLEKLEREKLARAQAVRKAAVERLLETRRKDREASMAAASQPLPEVQAPEPAQAPEVPVKQETAELPVEEKPVEASAQSSVMIFPQLDKESPASSTHEAVSDKTEVQDEPSGVATAEHSDEEFFEDAESIEVRSLSSDEGFMTDEEYDILDASDEEIV
jgi:next-to-BRCA1 protein 1